MLSLLLFTSILLSVTATPHGNDRDEMMKEYEEMKARKAAELIAGFKHIKAADIVQAMYTAKTPERLCRYMSCHGEENEECNKVCDQIAPKLDNDAMHIRMSKLNSTEPNSDLSDCNKDCQFGCGKNDCVKECAALCSFHFSFPNRKEYEAEMNELLLRVLQRPIDSYYN